MNIDLIFAAAIVVIVVVFLSARVPVLHFTEALSLLVLLTLLYSTSSRLRNYEFFDSVSDFKSFPATATATISSKFDSLIAALRNSAKGNSSKMQIVDSSYFSCPRDADLCDSGKIDKVKLQAHVNELVSIATMFEFMARTPPLDAILEKICPPSPSPL